MRVETITVHPFDDLRLLEYQGSKEVNEHSVLFLKGIIPFEKKEAYLDQGRRQIWVKVTAQAEAEQTCLFYGIIETIRVKEENGFCVMELDLRSGTFLMDFDKKTRSFQDNSMTYGELLDICKRSYEQNGKLMTIAEEKPIGQFIMQYQETDWEFIKRLASQNHTAVVPACDIRGVKYYFGIPDRRGNLKKDSVEYETEYDYKECWKSNRTGLSEITSEDGLSYCWQDREIYQLGEWTIMDGKHFFVWKIESNLKDGELYHTYWMRISKGFHVPQYFNWAISGTSLFGKVVKVEAEKVQIEMNKDENKAESGKCWFPFATVYSSTDGTGWYSMPEEGDLIRLYFPTEQESDAYVVSTYHEPDAQLRKNPDVKFWRNREGKEIQLSPEQILLTNQRGTYVRLSDADGIEIASEGSVSIRAKEQLTISSTGSSISFSAPQKIRLRQGETEMNLGGNLKAKGSSIKI